LASGAQRLAMLQRACNGQPDLIPDDWELRQRGPSWSLNTLRHFRTAVGPHRPLVLVIGADSLASLHQCTAGRITRRCVTSPCCHALAPAKPISKCARPLYPVTPAICCARPPGAG